MEIHFDIITVDDRDHGRIVTALSKGLCPTHYAPMGGVTTPPDGGGTWLTCTVDGCKHAYPEEFVGMPPAAISGFMDRLHKKMRRGRLEMMAPGVAYQGNPSRPRAPTELMTGLEAAEFCGVAPKVFWNYVHRNGIKSVGGKDRKSGSEMFTAPVVEMVRDSIWDAREMRAKASAVATAPAEEPASPVAAANALLDEEGHRKPKPKSYMTLDEAARYIGKPLDEAARALTEWGVKTEGDPPTYRRIDVEAARELLQVPTYNRDIDPHHATIEDAHDCCRRSAHCIHINPKAGPPCVLCERGIEHDECRCIDCQVIAQNEGAPERLTIDEAVSTYIERQVKGDGSEHPVTDEEVDQDDERRKYEGLADVINARDAAHLLGVPLSTLHYHADKGRLVIVEDNDDKSKRLYDRADVEAFKLKLTPVRARRRAWTVPQRAAPLDLSAYTLEDVQTKFMSAADAAEVLGETEAKVYELLDAGALAGARIGRATRKTVIILNESVEAYAKGMRLLRDEVNSFKFNDATLPVVVRLIQSEQRPLADIVEDALRAYAERTR